MEADVFASGNPLVPVDDRLADKDSHRDEEGVARIMQGAQRMDHGVAQGALGAKGMCALELRDRRAGERSGMRGVGRGSSDGGGQAAQPIGGKQSLISLCACMCMCARTPAPQHADQLAGQAEGHQLGRGKVDRCSERVAEVNEHNAPAASSRGRGDSTSGSVSNRGSRAALHPGLSQLFDSFRRRRLTTTRAWETHQTLICR